MQQRPAMPSLSVQWTPRHRLLKASLMTWSQYWIHQRRSRRHASDGCLGSPLRRHALRTARQGFLACTDLDASYDQLSGFRSRSPSSDSMNSCSSSRRQDYFTESIDVQKQHSEHSWKQRQKVAHIESVAIERAWSRESGNTHQETHHLQFQGKYVRTNACEHGSSGASASKNLGAGRTGALEQQLSFGELDTKTETAVSSVESEQRLLMGTRCATDGLAACSVRAHATKEAKKVGTALLKSTLASWRESARQILRLRYLHAELDRNCKQLTLQSWHRSVVSEMLLLQDKAAQLALGVASRRKLASLSQWHNFVSSRAKLVYLIGLAKKKMCPPQENPSICSSSSNDHCKTAFRPAKPALSATSTQVAIAFSIMRSATTK